MMKMGKRTRIINDPSDLVPLLRVFASKVHKQVFDTLQDGWMTEREIEEVVGYSVTESLDLLRRSGLIESKWRMPEPGKTPEKEYHSSYSRVQANFQCSLPDLSDLIKLTFTSDDELKGLIELLEQEVSRGNQSMTGLQRVLDRSPLYIRGAARRSPRLVVKGQRIELATPSSR